MRRKSVLKGNQSPTKSFAAKSNASSSAKNPEVASQPTTRNAPPEAVVIGASAGAIETLSRILPTLPRDYPLPILIVIHLPPDKKSALADLFSAKCQIKVKEAEDKETIVGSTVYFAPPNYHLLVEMNRSLSLSSDEPLLFSRPSIDVLFESATDAYGDGLVAIILTGANSDGARGLHAACSSGALALVQDPATAEAGAMPRAALEACPEAQTLSVEDIAARLRRLPDSKST